MTPQRLHAGLRSLRQTRSYLLGAMHDGTIRAKTFRIGQKERAYIEFLGFLIRDAGASAWTYREGAMREFFVVEFSRSFLEAHVIESRQDQIDYLRGFFDSDGGTPRAFGSPFYVYYAQKDRKDLERAREMLFGLGIACGRIHNPSARIDPEYWRFFVRRPWLKKFVDVVGSWHPRKSERFRMVI